MPPITDPRVQVERCGIAGILTLNRPEALNALDLGMLRALRATLTAWRDDPHVGLVILRGAGDRAFCAGGDVKAVWARRGDTTFMDEVYRVEYQVDRLIHEFGRPVVALMHGVTMGGGCGLAMHAAHRIVSEDVVLAMPETAIGLFPDVGASRILANCPDNIGLYLGLTGARIGPSEAIALGFADCMLPLRQHDALVECLAESADVANVIARHTQAPEPAEPVLAQRAEIAASFAADSARAILRCLDARGTDWATQTATLLRGCCPFSLEVTFRAISQAVGHSLAEVLASDFRVAMRLMERQDYFEGVRARLIDRDRSPHWNPAGIEEVDENEVAACFAPLPGQELWS